MKILVCGLNSYLGRASVQYLQDDNNEVVGLVRDANLLKSKIKESINASLEEVDLLIKDSRYTSFVVKRVDLAIYFTQIPDRNDVIGGNVELLSLKNYIQLCQRNGCNRILYVGRFYDRRYSAEVEHLMKEMGVDFTILLKDVAVGHGSSFDQFMQKMIQHKNIFLYKPYGEISFSPVVLSDVFQWIKKVDWKNNFSNSYVEFGGQHLYDMSQIMQLYLNKYGNIKTYRFIPIKNRMIVNSLNRIFYKIDYEVYSDYIEEVSLRPAIDNNPWKKLFDFNFTPIVDKI